MQRVRCALAWILVVAGSATATVATAQDQQSPALTAQIDRIFKTKDYDAPRFGPARWLPDGTAYAIVERVRHRDRHRPLRRRDRRADA